MTERTFAIITATDAEVAAGAFQEERAAAAADALWRDGAVVLAGVVDPAHLDAVRSRMQPEVPELIKRCKQNGPDGHYAQRPPVAAPYVFQDVMTNRLAVQVAALATGVPLQLTLTNANTILPNSAPQSLHRDHGNLWKDVVESHRPAYISVHVPLVDMDEKNGSTEVWPGTHRLAHEGAVPSDDAQLEARAAISPPLQVTCPVGGIILRDGRAWHRGMPNFSEAPRIMISMIYAAYWSRQGLTPLHRSAEAVLQDAPLEINPTWVDDDYDLVYG